jgi:hypothetical protein
MKPRRTLELQVGMSSFFFFLSVALNPRRILNSNTLPAWNQHAVRLPCAALSPRRHGEQAISAPRQCGWGNARAVQQLGELSAQGGVGSAQPAPLLLQRLRIQESLSPPPITEAYDLWLCIVPAKNSHAYTIACDPHLPPSSIL